MIKALLLEGLLYVNGQLRGASNGATYDDISPWTGEIIGSAPDATADDMNEAIAAARRAFDETDWSTNKTFRRELVKKLGEKLSENRDRLALIARHEAGAAAGAILGPQVDIPLGFFPKLLEIFDTLDWEQDMGRAITLGRPCDRIVVREAAGVVAAIVPWNVPLFITIGKVIPALLAGCTVILKPAPDTPLMGTIIGELAHEIGFPPGVLQVLCGKDPAMLGEMLVTDRRVDLVSFTGSTAIGKRIMEKGASTLKRVFLELGGKSASIILDDAPDFARALGQSILCFHAGQGCAVMSRLLIPRSRYEEAVAILTAAYAGYAKTWGNPEDPTNIMGPVISARQRDRVMSYIESGKQEGARLIAGGNLALDKGSGYFIEPTCFVDVTNDMKIAREEIFGPVLSVIAFEDDEDAIRIANDSDYGLSGSIRSGTPARAEAIARRIRTGSVGVNGGIPITVDLPFGGYKDSGIGREWGLEGFDEYLETKVLAFGVEVTGGAG